MTKEIILWVAGLFEGEGTIVVLPQRIRVAVQMTDLDVLQTVLDNFGGSLVQAKKQKRHHKKSWRWYLTNNKDTYNFLNYIFPFLHKRRQKKAQQAINAYNKWKNIQEIKSNKINIRNQKVIQLVNSGLTHIKIAQICSISKSYVGKIMQGQN